MNESKAQIIEKTTKLFIERGFNGVSLTDIQKVAGLSRGTFYYYFTSKEECFEDCVRYFLLNARGGAESGEPSTLREFIDTAIKAMIVRIDTYRSIDRISFLNEARKIIPSFAKHIEQVSSNELRLWRNAIDNAIRKGEIRDTIPSNEIAKLFIYHSDGAILDMSMQGNLGEFVDEVKQGWGNIYNMLKK